MKERVRRLLDWRTAGAELVIVIVGVIIALGVDSWWDDRQGKASEREHLVALRSEARTSLDSLRVVVERTEHIQLQVRTLLEVAQGVQDRPSADSLTTLAWGAFSYWSFEPLSTSYDNLVNTDGLTLLTSEDLRRDLGLFYSQLAIYHREDFQARQWEQVNQPFVNGRLRALDWTPAPYREEHALPAPRERTDWTGVLTDQEFEGILVNRFIAANDALNMMQKLGPTLERIVARIDSFLALDS